MFDKFEKFLSAGLLLASTIYVVTNIKMESLEVDQSVFIESASAMELDFVASEPSVAPLIIEKVIFKKSPVRKLAVAPLKVEQRNDDVGQLNEGKYSYEGLTFHVSNSGSVCHYSEDEVNGTLVTEYIYDTRLRDKSIRECL